MAKQLAVRMTNGSSHTIAVDDDYQVPSLGPASWVEFEGANGERLAVYTNNVEAVLVTYFNAPHPLAPVIPPDPYSRSRPARSNPSQRA